MHHDILIMVMFRDDNNKYSITIRKTNLELSEVLEIYEEHHHEGGHCYVDALRNKYQSMEWSELKDLTWQSKSLF